MRTWARRSVEGAAASARGALRRRGRRPPARIGWVAADTLHGGAERLSRLHPPISMRITNTAFWLNANAPRLSNEVYRPERRYDVVVFFKAMSEREQAEAERVKGYGGRVVFDANVNYYEVWGDYEIPRTQPTEIQQRDVQAMTKLADHIVADSTYLLGLASALNDRATWIPDNVDLSLYRGARRHEPKPTLRLVWSGVAQKAHHLLEVADALAAVSGLELVLVSDRAPEAMASLARVLPCSYVRFSDWRYAATLRRCDVIISPKRLVNAYELAHTEYKITLGMAVGLPAVASPQQSYVEAIGHAGGGIVADGVGEWIDALESLRDDPARRADLGARAQRTVREVYSTPVVSRRYLDVLESLL